MHKRQSNIDDYTIKWIQKLRKQGKTIKEISEITGYSKSAVTNHI